MFRFGWFLCGRTDSLRNCASWPLLNMGWKPTVSEVTIARVSCAMTQEEKIRLVVAMTTISDPCRNWAYGWKILCELADIDPAKMPAHFLTPGASQRYRSITPNFTKESPKSAFNICRF